MAYNLTFKFKPELPSPLDYQYRNSGNSLKKHVDLREWDSLVEDQFDLGSCTGNAFTNAYELLVKKYHPEEFAELSRLFVYYNIRAVEGTINFDYGGTIRSGVRAVSKHGICTEALWPYNIDNFNIAPTPECYEDAKKRKIKNYRKVESVSDMLDALSNDYPVVFGVYLYRSFLYLNKDNNIVPKPNRYDEILGGHAMSMVGYDLEKELLLAKNSFGTEWGDNGYCWIPFSYADVEVFDPWVFELYNPFTDVLVN